MIPPLTRPVALLILLAVTLFYAFFRLEAEPYHVADESRGGINALEMRANGDWVNLHYMGAPDEVRAKPPLLIWCISASMAVFGPTPFALRFPSAVAITLAFFVLFHLITLYRSPGFALLVGLLLLSVNGLVGWHVGRSGDFDALLLLFLLAGLYFLLQYLDFGRSGRVLGTGFFWGLAFLTKGLAMGALLPGLLVYLLPTRRLLATLRDRWLWAGIAVFALFPLAWFILVQRYGAELETPGYAGSNVFERLVLHDIWERFTQAGFEGRENTSRPDFILYSLDKMFNLWNIPFFGFLLYGLYRWTRLRGRALDWLRERRLLLLSLCLWFPYAVILSLTDQALRQYIVPVLPFVGIATVFGFDYVHRRFAWVRWVFFGLLAFTLGRRVYEFHHPSPEPAIVDLLPQFRQAHRIFVEPEALAFDELYYLYLANQPALVFDTTRLTGEFDYVIVRQDGPYRSRFVDRSPVLVTDEGVILR